MSIKKNFVYNALMTGFNAVFPLLTYPYVARVLGPDQMGSVNLFNSISDWFIFLLMLGIPTYGLREMARVRDVQKQANIVFTELLIINSASMVLFSVLYVFAYFTLERVRGNGAMYTLFYLPVFFSIFSLDWLFGGFENYRYIAIRGFLIKSGFVVLTYLLVRGPGDVLKYALIIVAGTCIPNAINVYHSRQFVQLDFSQMKLMRHLKPLLVFWGSVLAGSVFVKGDVVLLGFLSGNKYVAYYNMSKRIVGVLLSLTSALSNVIIPRLSYLHSNSQSGEYALLQKKSLGFLVLVSIPMIAISMLIAAPMIHMMGGDKYSEAIMGFRIIAPVILFTNLAGFLASHVMIPSGNERMILGMTSASAVTSFSCGWLLVPRFHNNASSLSTVLAEIAGIIVGTILIRKVANFPRMLLTSWKCVTAGGLSGLGAFFCLKVIPVPAFGEFLSAGAFIVFYTTTLLLMKDENLLIIQRVVFTQIRNRLSRE